MKSLRLYFIIISVIGAYSILVIRLYDLQITQGKAYAARAASQYRLAGFFEPHRGSIAVTDKNNTLVLVATNQSYPVIIAVPREIKDIDRAVENISPIFNSDETELRARLTTQKSYELLFKSPTQEQVARVSEANIPGVYIDEQEKRTYPFGAIASHVLGFVGPSGDDAVIVGRYGIEKYFDELLAGKPGIFENGKTKKPTQGNEVRTTLDLTIQTETEQILRNLITKHGATSGTIIVQEPNTGKILAMANAPDFNPNTYSDSPLSAFPNPAAQAQYEPGSIFKVITAAIGLNARAFTPNTTYYDQGSISFPDGKVINNWDLTAHGVITMTNVIEQSVNTGAAFMESKIGHQKFYDYLVAFGFDKPTEITLPGEVAGNVSNIEKYRAEIDFATASFGQGVAVTPLQLITALSAIANGGTLMKPYIVEKEGPQEVRQVLSKEAAQETIQMMVSAVRKAGVASIAHYTIAGKTGTAQVPDFKHGGYTKDVINTYGGFLPASKPRFTILIKLDKPAGAPLAGTTVVPAFRELAQFIINYYNIPPDNLHENN